MRRALLVLLCILPAFAGADYVRVEHSASIYVDPDRNSTVRERIRPAESEAPIYLLIAGDGLRNGYHNVHLHQGTGTGWIYKSRVRMFTGSPPTAGRNDVFGGYPDDSRVGDQVIRLENAAYVVGYSETKSNPLWVAYRLGADQGHDCPRLSRFRVDERTEARVSHDDYTNSGYDRGHMARSRAIGSRYGCPAQNETYRMSNIAPQLPTLNSRSWGGLENLEAGYPASFGQVWVFTGPIFDPVWLNRICSGVEIPVAFYKIIIRETGGAPDVLATIFEQGTAPGVRLSTVVTTVDEIERRTGIDFLVDLPDNIENSIEGARATDAAWQLNTALDTNFRPGRRDRCEMPRIRREEVD